MRVALEASGQSASVPDRICATCRDSLSGTASKGLSLRNERDNREKEKLMAWKNRVHLVKNARALMSQKAYSEAAVQYEKYLRVLELVHNLKKGELTPKVFNNSTRSKEITVIASVYWDLVRIYDTSPRYGNRMAIAAAKLSEFLQFSQIYPDVLKKADHFMRSAKNPQIVRDFLRASRGNRGGCFIATAAFAESPDCHELLLLRRFRDQRLRPSWVGRQFIYFYYKSSPSLATWIAQKDRRAQCARYILRKIIHLMQ